MVGSVTPNNATKSARRTRPCTALVNYSPGSLVTHRLRLVRQPVQAGDRLHLVLQTHQIATPPGE